MKVFIKTLGCKVNQYESEAMAELFEKKNYEIVKSESAADIIIVNTCSVTALAESKSGKSLRRAKRLNKEAIVCAVGCYSQVSENVPNMPEVDLVLGTGSKGRIVELVEDFIKLREKKVAVSEMPKDFEPLFITNTADRTRAVMKIQDGCNQFCSYCIIPYARGRIRSRSLEDIKREAYSLAQNGFKEVVLTGIHVASYAFKNSKLIDVIEKVSEVSGIERIRLSSLEQSVISDDFLERIKYNEKFCHHFHLSLQSGSASVLKRMNRHYTPFEYRKKVEKIRSVFPDCAITTDIIVGFPLESDGEFQETLNFVNEVKFSKIHIFPFSPRTGTPAAKMLQVPNEIKTERVEILTEIEKNLRYDFMESFLGKKMCVLAEKETENGFWLGHTSNYLSVIFKSSGDCHNSFFDVLIERREEDNLSGR